MSKVTFKKYSLGMGKIIIYCTYNGCPFGKIHQSNNDNPFNNLLWYIQFDKDIEISDGKILRAVAKKLDKLNRADEEREE